MLDILLKLNTVPRICNLSRTIPDIGSAEKFLFHVPCDLSDPVALEAAIGRVESWLEDEAPAGRRRVLLINNSGFGSCGPFPEPSLERQLAMMRLNALAPVHLTGRLLPLLAARGGVVLNVSSTASFQPTPWMATYGATKAFLTSWSLAMDEEWRQRGLRFVALCPGPTATNFFREAGFDAPPLSGLPGDRADTVAHTGLRAVLDGRPLIVSGLFNKVLVACSSRLPKVLVTRLSGAILKRVRLEARGQRSGGPQ